MAKYTEEIFTVTRILNQYEPVQYKIADYHGQEIKGSFYAVELQKVEKPDAYVIETILDQRGAGARKRYLIKWFGYGSEFNSWKKLDPQVVTNILGSA